MHFDNCTVSVLEGAVAAFDHCTLRMTKVVGRQSHPFYAVFAHGQGTLVLIDACCFEHSKYCSEACVVREGVMIHLEQYNLYAYRRASARASGARCKVSLQRCIIDSGSISIEGMLATPKTLYRGVSMFTGAHGLALGCNMNCPLTGVCVVSATAHILDT